MVEDVLKDCEERMAKSCEVFRRELAGIRAGRATPALLEKITVDYYGTPMPVNQVATITVPEPRLLVIQPWDRSLLPELERAIARSDLGLTPSSDGVVLRLALPQLTQERRQELIRQVRRLAEEERVAIRNIRREAMEMLRDLEREGQLPADAARRAQEQVQKLTDRFIADIDRALEAKEKEILEV